MLFLEKKSFNIDAVPAKNSLLFFLISFFRVWNVRYNHSHDQLILTGSSDSRVILSNMVSISSEPFGHMVDDDELSDQEDQHQEEKYEVS